LELIWPGLAMSLPGRLSRSSIQVRCPSVISGKGKNMLGPVKQFREKLHSGQLCVGCGITLSDAVVSEVVAPGADFLWIDLEHSHLDLETVLSHLMSARIRQVPALVRVRDSDIASIKPILDIGADGVVAPQMQSAAEVRRVVETCRYAPLGKRGIGPRRSSDYGRIDVKDYIALANQQVFVAIQVENVNALAEIDEIVSIEGLDSVVIGPVDLSHSLGYTNQLDHPRVVEAMKTIIDRTRAAGKFAGIGMGANEAFAAKAVQMGVQWMQCGEDFQFIADGVDQLYPQIRKLASP